MDWSNLDAASGLEAELPPECFDLFERRLLGIVGIADEKAEVNLTPVWILRQGNEIVFNTNTWRAKARLIATNQRVTICVVDDSDPMRYVQVRGVGRLTAEGARETIDLLARKYWDRDFRDLQPGERRLDVIVTPYYVDYHPDANMDHRIRVTGGSP
jgi:general stress protein 26